MIESDQIPLPRTINRSLVRVGCVPTQISDKKIPSVSLHAANNQIPSIVL